MENRTDERLMSSSPESTDSVMGLFRIPKKTRTEEANMEQSATKQQIPPTQGGPTPPSSGVGGPIRGAKLRPGGVVDGRRRRINLSEYMNKKNQALASSENQKLCDEIPASSGVSPSSLNKPSAAMATVARPEVASNRNDQFYKDILATLKSEEEEADTIESDNKDVEMACSGDDTESSGVGLSNLLSLGRTRSSSVDSDLANTDPNKTGILCSPGFQRNAKKSVSWADETGSLLESVKYIESEHDHEAIAPIGITIGKFEMQIERTMRMGIPNTAPPTPTFFSSCAVSHRPYGPLILVEIPGNIIKPKINSREREIQAERQKTTLQDIFLPCVSIPDTPIEPDPGSNDRDEREIAAPPAQPRPIPLEEVQDDEEMPVVEPKAPTAAVVPASLPPELAELLARAHQNQEQQPAVSSDSEQINGIPQAAITLLDQLRSILAGNGQNNSPADLPTQQTPVTEEQRLITSAPDTATSTATSSNSSIDQIIIQPDMDAVYSVNASSTPAVQAHMFAAASGSNQAMNPQYSNATRAAMHPMCQASVRGGQPPVMSSQNNPSTSAPGPILCNRQYWNAESRAPYAQRSRGPFVPRGFARPRQFPPANAPGGDGRLSMQMESPSWPFQCPPNGRTVSYRGQGPRVFLRRGPPGQMPQRGFGYPARASRRFTRPSGRGFARSRGTEQVSADNRKSLSGTGEWL